MKKIIFYTLILALFSAQYATAQQQTPPKPEKEKKEVIIIKEMVDDKGNVTIEKTIREAHPDEIVIEEDGKKTIRVEVKGEPLTEGGHMMIIKDGKHIKKEELEENVEIDDIKNVNVTVEVDEDGKKSKKIVIRTMGEEDVIIEEIEQGNLEDRTDIIEIRKEADENGQLKETYHIKLKDVDGAEMEWKGQGEIPAEIKEKMEKAKIQIAKENRMLHLEHQPDGIHENKAFLGVVADEEVEIVVTDDGEETTVSGGTIDGAPITEVVEGSAAEEAGLQADDVITSFDGQQVNNFEELAGLIGGKQPGDEVAIEYTRDGQTMTTTATLKGKTFKYAYVVTNEDVQVDREERIIIITRGKLAEEAEATPVPVIDETEFPAYDPNANKLEMEGFDAFPNPSDGLLQLQFKTTPGPLTIRVTNLSGQQMFREFIRDFDGIYNKQVDLTDLTKGAYLLTIDQEERLFTHKILIQ
jgi:hypothetical protein